jgi:membrane protease YdiL (CAAX protease family)
VKSGSITMKIVELDYNKENTVTRANKLFFVFCTLFLISRLAFTLYMNFQIELYGLDVANNMFDDYTYPLILYNEIVLVLLPALIYTLIYRLNIPYGFRFNTLKFKNLIIILLLSVPLYVFLSSVNSISYYFLQHVGDIPARDLPLPKNAREFILSLFIVAFIPAVCEEYFLRGILLNAYNRRGAFSAIISGGIFFSIFHFDLTNILAPFFFGVIIGYVVLRTNSIYAGILAHFLNNAIAHTMMFVASKPDAPAIVRISPDEFFGILLQCLVSLAVIFLLLMAIKALNPQVKLKKTIRNPFLGFFDIITHWPVLLSLVLYGLRTYFILIRVQFIK